MIFRKPNKLRVLVRHWRGTHILTHTNPINPSWTIETPVEILCEFHGITMVRCEERYIYHALKSQLRKI